MAVLICSKLKLLSSADKLTRFSFVTKLNYILSHMASGINCGGALKRACRHFDEIFVISCPQSCQNDNCKWNRWAKFYQNGNISVSVRSGYFRFMLLPLIEETPNVRLYEIMDNCLTSIRRYFLEVNFITHCRRWYAISTPKMIFWVWMNKNIS